MHRAGSGLGVLLARKAGFGTDAEAWSADSAGATSQDVRPALYVL